MLYEKLLRGKPRRLGQNAPLSRLMKIRLKFARFLPAKTPYIGEMLEKQRQLYLDMDVPVPTNVTSLCVDAGI